MLKKLTAKEAAFVQEFQIDLNATQAAIRAGYSPRHAHRHAPQILARPRVAAAIQAAQQERAERTRITADDVVRQLERIAFADPRDLISVTLDACRHCHGLEHEYQWTKREYEQATLQWEAEAAAAENAGKPAPPEPTTAGGFGFRPDRPPHPDCPMCFGRGRVSVQMNDTRNLNEAAQALYSGAKHTRNGLEVLMKDQMKALELLGKHLGMFIERIDHTSSGQPIIGIEIVAPDES